MPDDQRSLELLMRQMLVEFVGMRGQLMTLTEILMRIESAVIELGKAVRNDR